MDGLLVDSEPLWHEAEVEILGALGVPLVTDACRQTKGMFVREVTHFWHERYPWSGPSTIEVADEIVDRVIELVTTRGVLLPGVEQAIATCRQGGARLAVASSSEYRLISVVLSHFDLVGYFEFAYSAEEEPYGKPNPGVFLTAASRLGVAPANCVVFEDAAAGVLAAKAAKMLCVAVPEPSERDSPGFVIADVVLESLSQVDGALWDELNDRLTADPLSSPR